jgi:hypothetical protein
MRKPQIDKMRWWVALLLVISFATVSGVGAANAKGGGTAKPPKGAVSPWVVPTLGDPPFSVATANLHGFDNTGLIESVGPLDGTGCSADADTWGGTVTLNGIVFTIPCNLIVQMPANTLTWAQFVNGSDVPGAVPLKGLELSLVGNIVGSRYIAGLAYASQQSVNVGTGTITGFDYSKGTMLVDNGQGSTVRVQINDPVVDGLTDSNGNPTGRFSAGQSPDPRFSVDQDNPTIHAGTGYPMCIPRTDPAVANDPLCPQANRPLAPPSPNPAGIPACRNFSAAGVVPPAAGELSRPAAGQVYCSEYVMPPAPADNTTVIAGPDARQQAPFEVGDFVSYSGTLLQDDNGNDYVSAHTIEANIGIYTQPGTQPAYMAIGEFGVGTADPAATAANGAAQETQDRIFLETETTDVKTPVDIYYLDSRADGSTFNRWITPFEMTGENQTPLSGPTGGITTQNTGPQPQRARLRATKSPAGLLSQPSRNVRVAQRTLCMPTPVDPTVTTINQAALDNCFSSARRVANGLKAGQYQAPVFEYIFPENVMAGDLPVPNDLWHLPFLRSHVELGGTGVVNGEGAGHTGALIPSPW